MNRKRVILGALLGVLTVCLVYAYLATPRLEKAPPRAAGRSEQAVDVKSAETDERGSSGRIDFAYLASAEQEFGGAQRDIFRFGQRRPVKTAPAPRVVQRDVPKPVVMPKVAPVAVAQKSLSQFTFLGFLEKGGEKTVFLSSGGNLFLVKQGDRFGASQEFLVVQIDDRLLKVSHAGREGLIEVQLIEQQKLDAAVSAPVSTPRTAGSAGQPVNARPVRSKFGAARPAAQQEYLGFQGGVRQRTQDSPGDEQQEDQIFQGDMQPEDQVFQSDVQPEDQVFQGDDNSWPAKER